ncbi:MAG: anti-sigma regulatory factor [Arenimonas sp.]|nr:anti-sigma regulatory factor [Arenimonas sp.]
MDADSTGERPLRTEADIVACRQTVRQLVVGLKFSLVDQTKMITAASELSRNTVVHGGGGRMRWELVEDGLRRGLRLHFEDDGPGIPDTGLALTDGWTSGGGMGLGLPGSKRLVHEFALRSAPGEGTCVSILRWK